MRQIAAEYTDGAAAAHQGDSGSRFFKIFQGYEGIHEFIQTLDRDGMTLPENTLPYVGITCQRSGMALGSVVARWC